MENEQKAVNFLNEKYRGKLADNKETLELAKQLLVDFLNENDFKLATDEEPISGVELLVKDPKGVLHLASWRESYKIFTNQEKHSSTRGWSWKYINNI